ncbi:MAG TPA: Rrf2 family transcriptional regulator [Wenzhouxiangella sp.]|nr:Rrf2 family transcriptional regulator [Wenzhouxiangella sp.]HLS05546.1 Rrf2 family transcriptional regulator [Wenzhouxiangella sp.]
MRLTHYTDYTLRVLTYLGARPGQRSTIREISEAYDVSRNHLMKVVQQLAAEGWVDSVRGVGGGLMLADHALDVSIGTIVRAVEVDFDLVECMRADNECAITPACRLAGMLREARQAFFDVLERYTLGDLISSGNRNELAGLLGIRLRIA